ncbi:molecular chaperone [Adlercreutzia sp. ZJ138]|uniref:TorD/DmsD family molecular chaperone n=1 Tax=Adlercreutzia sp. ZJ138 TaxID=2709405 RepID=UPI0013ED6DEA|nr:molecular chaperone TorD family protein [Adlercreutzia sp. ZJ138]
MERNAKDSTYQEEQSRWREALYRLASAAFLEEPTDEQLVTQIETARAALAEEGSWELPCEQQLLTHLASLDESDADLGRRVRSEYAELFIGPRPPKAPLYESMYRGCPRRLLTQVTRQVRDTYESCGFTVAKRNRIPDDHIGYELEFAANLCAREALAWEEDRVEEAVSWQSMRHEFLEEHVSQWIGGFASAVELAEGGYFGPWARFAQGIIEADVETGVGQDDCAQGGEAR